MVRFIQGLLGKFQVIFFHELLGVTCHLRQVTSKDQLCPRPVARLFVSICQWKRGINDEQSRQTYGGNDFYFGCVCVLSCLVRVQLFAAPWTVAHQAPLSMRFSRQEYWSGLPFPSPGDLPDPGMETMSLAAPALSGEFFTTKPPRKFFMYPKG